MNLIIINSGQKFFLKNCLNSLINTTNLVNFDIHVIKEREYREVTFNTILKGYDSQDILIFGDDIVFTKGWFEFLTANKKNGDIIGFSMLYPGTDKVQDTGYDLVRIDNEIILKPKNRGEKKEKIKKFNFRECDSSSGCALFIKKNVAEKIRSTPVDGMNRWGEFLYMNEAKKKGFKVIVLGHYLYHHGKSTKINPNKLLSSESYMLEQKMWKKIVKQYINKEQIKIQLKKVLSKKIRSILLSKKKILFYGAGTISEFILKELKSELDLRFVDICSGLSEEKEKIFCGKRISFYKNVDFSNYDIVIVSVLQKEKVIFDLIKNFIDKKKLYYVVQETIGCLIKFGIKQYA